MIRRQHVSSRTAREHYRAGAPESMSRTPASSTPPDELLPASFPVPCFIYFCEVIRAWWEGFPRVLGPS